MAIPPTGSAWRRWMRNPVNDHQLLRLGGRLFPVTPRKTNMFPLKRDYFNRKYIFQPSFFRGYVSFQGGIYRGFNTLPGGWPWDFWTINCVYMLVSQEETWPPTGINVTFIGEFPNLQTLHVEASWGMEKSVEKNTFFLFMIWKP